MPNDDVKTATELFDLVEIRKIVAGMRAYHFDGREALIAVVRALRDLDDETKRRVIEAACVFIGVKVNF